MSARWLSSLAPSATALTAAGADVDEAAHGSARMADLVARRVEAEQRTFCEAALQAARDLLAGTGGVRLADRTVTWQLTEPSGARRPTALPVLLLGGQEVVRNDEPRTPSTFVDDVRALVSGTCTVFQRTPDGAMLRVATNVVGADARRAVGTVLTTTTATGAPSPALAAVQSGRTYVGEANVLGTEYYTAYAPLLDEDDTLVGVLYVGLPKQLPGR